MRINYNVTGEGRKALVKVIAEATGEKARYMKLPTYSYEIGSYTVTRDGTLEYEDGTDAEAVLSAITAAGFAAEPQDAPEAPDEEESEAPEETAAEPADEAAPAEETEPEPETAPEPETTATTEEDEATGLTVELPIDKVSVGNLTNILAAKSTLIRHALGIDDLQIAVTDDKVSFPWFKELPEPDEVQAYTHFIAALCKHSKDLKRASATETPVPNEKYAFRCFLLRLGFIGAEYKGERKILLRNLSGNSSWKNGAPEKPVQEAPAETEVATCEA